MGPAPHAELKARSGAPNIGYPRDYPKFGGQDAHGVAALEPGARERAHRIVTETGTDA